MAFNDVISALRQAEQRLVKQLEGIRGAIESLEFGSAVSPSMPARSGEARKGSGPRKRRRLSAKARAAISRAQKLRWAKQRAAQKQ